MKTLLRRYAEDAIRQLLDNGHHLGELMADTGMAINAYDETALNKHWLNVVYYTVCGKFYSPARTPSQLRQENECVDKRHLHPLPAIRTCL